MRKRTVNTYPALPQQAHPQVPKPATRHSPPRLVFTHPLAVISPYWLTERPMRRPIAFRPTCSLVFSVPVCSNVCTPLPPGYAWLLRPCPLVCHAILKGDRALPSGVGPADSRLGEGVAAGTVYLGIHPGRGPAPLWEADFGADPDPLWCKAAGQMYPGSEGIPTGVFGREKVASEDLGRNHAKARNHLERIPRAVAQLLHISTFRLCRPELGRKPFGWPRVFPVSNANLFECSQIVYSLNV